MWLVLVILFALVVEFIGDRLEHEVSLSSYSEQELQEIYGARFLDPRKNEVISNENNFAYIQA